MTDPPALPKLTSTPTHHPTCCVSLSLPLLSSLYNHLSPIPGPILSVGSGSGLLEAHLLRHGCPRAPLDLRGADLSNVYLPPDRFVKVKGTWDTSLAGGHARSMVFVYPKEVPMLFRGYITSRVQMIIWIGPVADANEVCETVASLAGWNGVLSSEVIGVTQPYEKYLVWSRGQERC